MLEDAWSIFYQYGLVCASCVIYQMQNKRKRICLWFANMKNIDLGVYKYMLLSYYWFDIFCSISQQHKVAAPA